MKKNIIVCGMLAVLAICVCLVLFLLKKNEQLSGKPLGPNDKDWSTGEYETYQITKKNPTEIVWIGDWYGAENISSETVRFADEINFETLALNSKYQRMAVVVNEMTSDLCIDKSQYEILFKYMINNPNYYFMYYGKDDLPLLGEISGKSYLIRDIDRSMGFNFSKGGIVTTIGTYTLEEMKYDFNLFDTFVDWLGRVYDDEDKK